MKIVLDKGQKLFFTSDTHYSHANICSATTSWVGADNLTRKFKSLDQMNDTLVNNINQVVGENDILIHLGDWSFGGFESIKTFYDRLICKNIHLILGNHDKNIERNNDEVIITIVWNNKEDYYNFIKNNAQLYIDSFIERQNFVLANNIKTTLELIEN